MLTLHFEGRDVPPYAEYAPADTLVEGKTYFRLGYLDKDLTIPKMNPMHPSSWQTTRTPARC